jgi:hypothetical protein
MNRIPMATIDIIRNQIIDKLLTIRDKEFLLAMNDIINQSDVSGSTLKLTPEQELMLEMSEADILNNRTISNVDVKMKAAEW